MKKFFISFYLFVFSISAISPLINAEYRVHIPNRVGDGPIGIYMEADYDSYPHPINIDFTKKQTGNDWRAVLSNYYHSIYTQDKSAYLSLYTDKDGDLERVRRFMEVGLSFGPDVKLMKVELFKVFRKGKLVIPRIKRKITPDLAGLSPMIFCEEDNCYLAQNYRFLTERNFIRPLKENYSTQATASELKDFERVRNTYQQYKIQPSYPIYRAPEQLELTPAVYLNLKRYPKRRRFTLNLNTKSDISIPADIAPIIELFSNIKTLTFEQKRDKTLYSLMYVQAFKQEKILKRRLPLFNDRDRGYQNERSTLFMYTDRVWHWDAIVPVGYLEHGGARFIYFYPETGNYPLTKQGRPMIQVLPVSQDENGYYLDIENLIYSRLDGLQFPEAIELAMEYFDPELPAYAMTASDKVQLQRTEAANKPDTVTIND